MVALIVSRWTPGGGHEADWARSVKYAAKSPLKNMSSEDSQTIVPTLRRAGAKAATIFGSGYLPDDGDPPLTQRLAAVAVIAGEDDIAIAFDEHVAEQPGSGGLALAAGHSDHQAGRQGQV